MLKTIAAGVLVGAVVPLLVFGALAWLLPGGRDAAPRADSAAVSQRIRPVGEVKFAQPAAAQKGPRSGEQIVSTTCAACHATGAAGAPKTGDRDAWGPRLARGLDQLTESVLKGKGAMPPRGGAADLTDAEIALAVIYLAGQAK